MFFIGNFHVPDVIGSSHLGFVLPGYGCGRNSYLLNRLGEMVLCMGSQERHRRRSVGSAGCKFALQRRVRIQAVGSIQGCIRSRVL